MHGKGGWLATGIFLSLALALALAGDRSIFAQDAFNQPRTLAPERPVLPLDPPAPLRPEGLSASLQILILLTVLSLVPAILLMTTSFVRILVVLALLRQAIGTQQLPPSQVITALAFFVTVAIMAPVWQEVYHSALKPYTERQLELADAWDKAVLPIRRFMSAQIDRAGNSEDVWLFLRYTSPEAQPATYDEVPLHALVPAFMLSELKTAFLIGFQIFLPFLVIDMVTATVLVSMGMLMVPPALVSLPLKLAVFVLLDGWHLVVGMLLESFAPVA
ncbi:MAG: flagellar type III secretion system pore protein FliP [Thermoguttaceae bacterium]|nr:flagellar type III secretion system pore protein FliP [Thermoguttaceae bacterium]MDW8079296.1 flagellar type III secretion system pore protein FliP [Thermoguttaceae bacterium]